ncbi:MAG: ABC transporter ATP-binding protein [Verrucomicrobiota bacterium]
MLTVSQLSKSYDQAPVLRGVDLALSQGERIALMGPSGSGKSTLLNCLGGLDRPDEGTILLDDQQITGMNESELCALRRTQISTIFQFFHLLPTLTAKENIEFPMLLESTDASERDSRLAKLIAAVELEHRQDAYPHEMSGGERQRVAIARALSIRPRLILADEPTGNLDSRTGEKILDLIAELSSEHDIAMILVTHSADVTRICDRTLEMKDGVIVE